MHSIAFSCLLLVSNTLEIACRSTQRQSLYVLIGQVNISGLRLNAQTAALLNLNLADRMYIFEPIAVLLVNRAMCQRKKEVWDLVKQDAEAALSLDSHLMKVGQAKRMLHSGHYCGPTAALQIHLGCNCAD